MSKENNLELLCRMAHAESLQEICDLTYQIIGNPVFISDLAHTILSYTKCVDIQDSSWHENVVLAHLQRNSLRQNRQVGTVHLASSNMQRPVLVEDDHLPFPGSSRPCPTRAGWWEYWWSPPICVPSRTISWIWWT